MDSSIREVAAGSEAGDGVGGVEFVRRVLVTSDSGGTKCGFDGQGPVGIWSEGTAQYVTAGGRARSNSWICC